MKKYTIILIMIISAYIINSQENKYFLKLEQKQFVTFSDGISMLRLLFDEKDTNAKFVDNLLWALDKKLFQVKIPIKPDMINPILSRGELAFWICKVFNGNKGLVNNVFLTRYSAYKVASMTGIISEGRGIADSISGKEILQIFALLDNYVRSNKIKSGFDKVLIFEDEYQNLPQWRAALYKELDEQREAEMKKIFKNKKQTKPERNKNDLKEKFIDKEDLRLIK